MRRDEDTQAMNGAQRFARATYGSRPRELRSERDSASRARLRPETDEDRDTADLVTRLEAGDEQVFAVLYQRYVDRVYRYATMLLGDAYEAENVTHDVFVAALDALRGRTLREPKLRAWLFVTTKNMSLMHRRKHGRMLVIDHSALSPLCEQRGLAESSDPETGPTDDIWRLTTRLPSLQREVLELRFRHDMAAEDVAERLGRSRPAIDQAQHRALNTLRRRFGAQVSGSTGSCEALAMRRLAWPAGVMRALGCSIARGSI